MPDSKKGGAYGAPPAGGDTDFRKTWDLDEYAAKANEREAREKEERKARYEAKLAGKTYHKPLTGDETYTTARRNVIDLTAQVGKSQLVPVGAGVGKRGRSAGFYCEACDLTFKDNKQYLEHINTMQHLLNTGQTMEVKRATVEEVRERIAYWVRKRDELEKDKATATADYIWTRLVFSFAQKSALPTSALPLHKIIWVFEHEGEESAPVHSMELNQDHGTSWTETGTMKMLRNEVLTNGHNLDFQSLTFSAEVEVDEMTIKSKITNQDS
ncbi:hypothetical protein C2857_006876 [Epichloe festucae Fl1]|uniref:C2H2-type domain-containing protein n=1 Tax=Epichloe festucae (strain Fl1) TaxID=877507 RepID=A0A7S9PSU2_EPIFF|nr:hypothetical protein C2857_006876 [Epichloe festucae Fl1]